MIIGLTGGIGSGKSTVARLLQIMGCAVFNSDIAAREVYFYPEVKPKVVALLGNEAYLSETSINKSYISAKIFSDKALLQQLNSIIHPAVINDFKQFARQSSASLIVKETALLFELGMEKEMDRTILIASEDELRIKRVMQRDGLSRNEVLKKINSQFPQQEKIKKATFVIYNNEEELLITQVLSVIKELTKH